jgi:hypothetical protein
MAEEIIKAAATGAVVSGGVGGVTDPAEGILGTPGTPSVDGYTSDAGILSPEQSRQFIEYVWDNTVLAKDGRRVTMRANTMELEKLHVGERVLRAAAQADATYTNADVAFTKVELKTTKIRLDWEVATESLEDNIEGAALEDHLVRTMTRTFASDLEDLAINGVGSGSDNFLKILEGFVAKESDGTEYTVTKSTGDAWTVEDLQGLINAMPRKFRAARANMKFYAGTDVIASILNSLGQMGSGAVVERIVGDVVDGRVPGVMGPAVSYRVLGIPLVEVPLMPAGYISLTFPENRVWGFQRDVTVHREFKPKKDTMEYTVFVRFGVQLEEPNAVTFADAASDA